MVLVLVINGKSLSGDETTAFSLTLHDEELVVRLDDAAVDGNGARSDDVVARHHPHNNAGFLADAHCVGHLITHGVLRGGEKICMCICVRVYCL